jgi:hypothetical protein
MHRPDLLDRSAMDHRRRSRLRNVRMGAWATVCFVQDIVDRSALGAAAGVNFDVDELICHAGMIVGTDARNPNL